MEEPEDATAQDEDEGNEEDTEDVDMADAPPGPMVSPEEDVDEDQRSFATAPEDDGDVDAEKQPATGDQVADDLEVAAEDHTAADDQAALDDDMAMDDEPTGEDPVAGNGMATEKDSRIAHWLRVLDAMPARKESHSELDCPGQCLNICRTHREALNGFLPFAHPSHTSTSRGQHARQRAASCPGKTHLE